MKNTKIIMLCDEFYFYLKIGWQFPIDLMYHDLLTNKTSQKYHAIK